MIAAGRDARQIRAYVCLWESRRRHDSFSKYVPDEVKIDGEEYFIISESSILAVIGVAIGIFNLPIINFQSIHNFQINSE